MPEHPPFLLISLLEAQNKMSKKGVIRFSSKLVLPQRNVKALSSSFGSKQVKRAVYSDNCLYLYSEALILTFQPCANKK